MGQAKARGSLQERVAAAVAKQLQQEPINIKCQTCKAILNGFEHLKSSPEGALWVKTCACGAITHALVQPENLSSPVNRTFAASKKYMDIIAGPEKKNSLVKNRKLSVAFFEKSVDSVETGIVRIPPSK